MTNHEAIQRLQDKRDYALKKAAENVALGKSDRWQQFDAEAFETAIAALRYTEEMRIYELSSPL